MDSAAFSLGNEAKLMWHHYTTASTAEQLLARVSSPALLVTKNGDESSCGASKEMDTDFKYASVEDDVVFSAIKVDTNSAPAVKHEFATEPVDKSTDAAQMGHPSEVETGASCEKNVQISHSADEADQRTIEDINYEHADNILETRAESSTAIETSNLEETVSIPTLSSGDTVLGDWEIVNIEDIQEVERKTELDISCSKERVLAESLVKELKCELEGVAAFSALTQFIKVVSTGVGGTCSDDMATLMETRGSDIKEVEQVQEEEGKKEESKGGRDEEEEEGGGGEKEKEMEGGGKEEGREETREEEEEEEQGGGGGQEEGCKSLMAVTEIGDDSHENNNEITYGHDQAKVSTAADTSLLATPLPIINEVSLKPVVPTSDVSTNTILLVQEERGTSPAPPPQMDHASSQTTISCKDLFSRAKEMEQLEMLKVELHMAQSTLNKEKSQRQVAEELVKIVQSDFSALTEKNMTEVMSCLQLENDLTDVKAELSHTSRQLKEKEERIQELEDTLKGTTLMVRKLEEQNSATLINRGGIDYMLQARLADGRAKEAEQKLQMLQTELLQSQGEVRMLLDRVSESSRDRAEMVSSKVHTQLMAIADERVATSERRAQLMERELLELKGRLSLYEKGGGPGLDPSHHPTGLGRSNLTGLTSSGLTGLQSYGLSGPGGLAGGGYSGLGVGGYSASTGFTGLGGGLTGMGSGLTGLGGGLTGLSGGLNLTSSSPPSYSPYSTTYPGQSASLQEQYNLHSTPSSTTSSSLTSKGIGSGSHDISSKSHDEGTSFTLSSAAVNGTNDITLPTFSSALSATDYGSPSLPLQEKAGDHDDSDSSDWSSSDEEGGKKGEGLEEAMKPSTHSTLIAEWEWRSMNTDADVPFSGTPQSPKVGPAVRKLPPPVAPKPTFLHHVANTTITMEPSSSFEEPSHAAALPSHSLQKPRGPSGRKVPSRWRQQHLFFN